MHYRCPHQPDRRRLSIERLAGIGKSVSLNCTLNVSEVNTALQRARNIAALNNAGLEKYERKRASRAAERPASIKAKRRAGHRRETRAADRQMAKYLGVRCFRNMCQALQRGGNSLLTLRNNSLYKSSIYLRNSRNVRQ